MAYARSLAALSAFAVLAGCGARAPSVHPSGSAPTPSSDVAVGAKSIEEAMAANTRARTVPTSMITHGIRAAELARQPAPPGAPECATEQRKALTFEHTPTYTEHIERDGSFSARLFIGNPAACTRKISLPLSFTPPKTTQTRTVDFAAYVPPRGAFVELALAPDELAESDVTPGRYAITFAVLDEEGNEVGRALSGNPFRLGRDDVSITKAPTIPVRIGVGEELVIPLSIENLGDTANRVTPLVVFTRPGETAGIEHYEPPQLVIPGASTYTLRLSQRARASERIGAGSWLVTVTMFDAAGERLNSFAGLPLTIGNVDIRMTRPVLPARVASSAPIVAKFKVENRGDTKDKITAVIAFTKPGAAASTEFTFVREVVPGTTVFDAVVEAAARRERAVDKGVWLVSTAAFQSSGERIKTFTGHYLEIAE